MITSKQYLKRIYHKNKSLLIITSLLSILQAIALIAFAINSKNILDGEKDKLLINAIILACNIILVIFLNTINQYLQHLSFSKTEKMLKAELYQTILKKDFQTISSMHSGKLMNYLTSDVSLVANSIATIIPNMFLLVTRLILAFGVVIYYLPYLGIYFGTIAILVFTISFSLRKKLKVLHKNVQEQDGISRSYLQESIASLQVIKAFVGEDKSTKKASDYLDSLLKAKNKKALFSNFINLSINLIFQISYVVTLVYAIWYKHNTVDLMSYGKILALVQLVGQIQGPMTNLSGLLPKYYTMQASSERIINIYNLKDENQSENLNIDEFDSITFNNVSFGYDEKIILKDINLKINKNEIILIKGTSGIGKSTFLKLLLALYEVNEGSIIVNDKINISNDTRKLFSYVPQGNFIISGTIKENLTFFNSDVTDEQLDRALEIACAKEFVESLEYKLNTVIGEKGLGLSEGQIQRLAIARAIINDSSIILLDEATSALDKDTEISVLNNLKKIENKTCIIVTHKDASKTICNKEFIFKDGQIFEENL